MTARRDEAGLDLEGLRAALAPFGARIGARRILHGDSAAFAAATPMPLERRRAGGAARLVARRLIAELGGDADAPLPRGAGGAPVWPPGFLGSLAHDDAVALAAVARRGPLAGLGVDIEANAPLPQDVVDLALDPGERAAGQGPAGRLIFACKEAVYKAIHPLDATPLEYADISVALDAGLARLADGRSLRLFTYRGARLVAVAVI